MMIKTWMVYTMMFGFGLPTHDDTTFTNESACQIYLHMQYPEQVQNAFSLICVNTSPTICQGEVCK
jgi:hypothetical protein